MPVWPPENLVATSVCVCVCVPKLHYSTWLLSKINLAMNETHTNTRHREGNDILNDKGGADTWSNQPLRVFKRPDCGYFFRAGDLRIGSRQPGEEAHVRREAASFVFVLGEEN